VTTDNAQGILGTIGLFWAKWGLGRVPRSRSFLCGNPDDLSATSQQPIYTKFGHKTYFGVPSMNRERHFRKYHLWVICPQNLKSKIGQTGISLRANYKSRDALQRDTVYPRCNPRATEFPRSVVAELQGVKVAQFSDFGLFTHTKPLKRTFR